MSHFWAPSARRPTYHYQSVIPAERSESRDRKPLVERMKRFFVYILATRKDGPIYVGVTSNLHKRTYEHRTHVIRGFTAKYNIDRLVWFEPHEGAEAAIRREKQIKRWQRAWKKELIEAENPEWNDLFEALGPS